MWTSPDRCECDGATEYYERKDEENLREMEELIKLHKMEEHQRNLERLFKRSQLPERFKERTFRNFRQTETNTEAYKEALAYAQNFSMMLKDGQGLMFIGTVGTGKTHLAAAIVQSLIEQGETVLFGTVTSLLGRIRATYGDSRETEEEVMREIQNCRLLVIDDLGKEKPTEWVEQTLYEIINHRYEFNKPLIITTNTSLKGIEEQYKKNGEAIVSRIAEMCKGVKMSWGDYRKGAAS